MKLPSPAKLVAEDIRSLSRLNLLPIAVFGYTFAMILEVFSAFKFFSDSEDHDFLYGLPSLDSIIALPFLVVVLYSYWDGRRSNLREFRFWQYWPVILCIIFGIGLNVLGNFEPEVRLLASGNPLFVTGFLAFLLNLRMISANTRDSG